MVKCSKYIAILIFLVEVVIIGYNQVCNQTLSKIERLQQTL